MKPLAIVKMGSTLPPIAAARGDFEDWIRTGLAIDDGAVSVVDVPAGEALPDPTAISGDISVFFGVEAGGELPLPEAFRASFSPDGPRISRRRMTESGGAPCRASRNA